MINISSVRHKFRLFCCFIQFTPRKLSPRIFSYQSTVSSPDAMMNKTILCCFCCFILASGVESYRNVYENRIKFFVYNEKWVLIFCEIQQRNRRSIEVLVYRFHPDTRKVASLRISTKTFPTAAAGAMATFHLSFTAGWRVPTRHGSTIWSESFSIFVEIVLFSWTMVSLRDDPMWICAPTLCRFPMCCDERSWGLEIMKIWCCLVLVSVRDLLWMSASISTNNSIDWLTKSTLAIHLVPVLCFTIVMWWRQRSLCNASTRAVTRARRLIIAIRTGGSVSAETDKSALDHFQWARTVCALTCSSSRFSMTLWRTTFVDVRVHDMPRICRAITLWELEKRV